MLTVKVSETEWFDEATNEFITRPGFELTLEHSLLSLSKWESLFEKPFLSKKPQTKEETLKYIECMLIEGDPPENFVAYLSPDNLQQIHDYVASPQTATIVNDVEKSTGRGETITSEMMYYWMNALQIPMEVEQWHLNRLFSLIRIHNAKNQKPKKRSPREIATRNREINAQRRKQLNTSG